MFFPFAWASEMTSIKLYSTESRVVTDHQIYCFLVCTWAFFSPEILQAGAVKGLYTESPNGVRTSIEVHGHFQVKNYVAKLIYKSYKAFHRTRQNNLPIVGKNAFFYGTNKIILLQNNGRCKRRRTCVWTRQIHGLLSVEVIMVNVIDEICKASILWLKSLNSTNITECKCTWK